MTRSSESALDHRPASLSWLNRFQICLEAECEVLFGPFWRVTVDPENLRIMIQNDRQRQVDVPMHPGMHAVTPIWAAHRIADQLQWAAIVRGMVDPPKTAVDDVL